jgi:branched-chain amino acid transport system permease protein
VGTYTEYWTFVLGVILILLIFFLPEGVMSLILNLFQKSVQVQPKEDGPGASG